MTGVIYVVLVSFLAKHRKLSISFVNARCDGGVRDCAGFGGYNWLV